MASPASTEALIEARRLSQWYVELLLLNHFGYTGSYLNRIKNEWEPVPWASSSWKERPDSPDQSQGSAGSSRTS